MTNITIKSAPLTVRAQGIDREVNPSDFHADALESIFAYGLRRWFQDNVNSAAHVHKSSDATDDFDVGAAFDARHEQAVTGNVHIRGATSADPLTTYRRKAVRALATANDKLAKAIKDCADTTARNQLIDAIAAKNEKIVEPMALELKAKAEANAKAAAKAGADITI